jgi:hypothetical protein
MTEPERPPIPANPPAEPSPTGDIDAGNGRPRVGTPAPPGSFDGRARSFREEQRKQRSARRERIGTFLVVIIIVLGVYTIMTARPYSASSRYEFPPLGPTIVVNFGTPSGASSVTCSAGGTAYVERVPWTNSTQPVSTGDVSVRVYEIFDGDTIGDPNAVANVTSSNVCAGASPDSTALWYVVLAAPNGTNLLTYTGGHQWTAVTPGPADIDVQNGSALILVTNVSLAGTGRGIAVLGLTGTSQIRGTVAL